MNLRMQSTTPRDPQTIGCFGPPALPVGVRKGARAYVPSILLNVSSQLFDRPMRRFNMSTGTHLNPRPTRRTLLMTGAAATAASALGTWAIPSAMARNLRAQTFGSTVYDNALKVD